MNKGRLFFLIGLARSGKSTFAKNWMNYKLDIVDNNEIRYRDIQELDFPRVVVCSDWIRLAIHGQAFSQEAEQMVHAIKMMMIRMYINNGYNVLVDGTHTTDKSILDLLRVDKNAIFYVVDTPAYKCKERAIATNQPWLIDRGVIDRMNDNLKIWITDAVTYINALREKV